jgi:hypothetical protein
LLLHEVLYVSTLAPESPLSTVSRIAAHARRANHATDITGLLVFDGRRFCQFFEGPRDEVLALTQKIRHDSRHTHMAILHQGPVAERRFKGFRLGYLAVEDDEVLVQLERAGPQEAIEQFLALLPSLDLQL